MVNIIPANIKFFPTDHCGVLRVNSNDISTKFLSLALEAEGIYEGFSRNKRASTQRIKDLTLLIPDKTEQLRIENEFIEIENAISSEQQIINSLTLNLKRIFLEMFGDPIKNEKGFPKETVDDNIEFQGGSQPSEFCNFLY